MTSWSRRKHFEYFNAFDYPHFSLCANVDITAFHSATKQHGLSFTTALVYVLAEAANAIPEFRYRIHEGQVVEHEVIHPSFIIPTEGDLFSFCTIPYAEDFSTFAERTAEVTSWVKEHPTLENEPGQDNLLYMSAIPWVSFTSHTHPINMHPADSVPRIAWGKFFTEGNRLKMPLSVQAHHALMDGIHLGRYFARVQEHFDQPGSLFESLDQR